MADDAARIAQLEAELAAAHHRETTAAERADRAEAAMLTATEQLTATAEILRVIATAPTSLRRVLDAVTKSL